MITLFGGKTMTTAEKLAMYKEKEQAVKDLSKFFRKSSEYPSVATIEYGVCSKNGEVADDTDFEEWIDVHFVPFSGNYTTPCRVTGKSITEISKLIGQLVKGGRENLDNYAEIAEYMDMLNSDYKFIDLG
jgi:hypothetical protein